MTARQCAIGVRTGGVITSARTGGGETLRALGLRLGCTASFLCDIEKGRRFPALKHVTRWADILGVTRVWLVQCILQDQVDAARLPMRLKVRER